MRYFALVAVALAALALVSVGVADNPVKSGPQVGQVVPGPFHPLNVTGPNAGEKHCLYCENGDHPVAMIFAREVSEPVTQLIKKIDTATAEHQDAQMGSFVVFLGDTEELTNQLKQLAEKENIKRTVLSVDNPAGPQAYKVSRNADVTVVLYTQHRVKANYAFAKGEMKDRDVDQIVADVSKILPSKTE